VVLGVAQSEAGVQQAVMEASLSVEVAVIVLDAVTLYVNSFKVIGCFSSDSLQYIYTGGANHDALCSIICTVLHGRCCIVHIV